MTTKICYVCNGAMNVWRSNLAAISLKYSKVSVKTILMRFLKDVESCRNIDDKSNGICVSCCNNITEYDTLRALVLQKERELKNMFLTTEKFHYIEHQRLMAIHETKIETLDDEELVDVIIEEECTVKQEPDDISENGQASGETESVAPGVKIDSGENVREQHPHALIKRYYKKLRAHKYTCTLCDTACDSPRSYSRHMKWHKENPLVCRVCKFVLIDEKSYKEHVTLHKHVPKGQCVICNKSARLLKVHMRMHSKPSHMCQFCGKLFRYEWSMLQHQELHSTEDYPEKCPQCSKSFKTKVYLKSHIRTHSNERPFACSFCDRRFKVKDHCHQHERRHRGIEKNHKCTLCEAAYQHNIHLRQHMERKHGVKMSSGSLYGVA